MKRVELPEITLNVYDEGDGEVILFVHAFPLDHTIWQPQLEAFSDSHRVIAPDLRGFGLSEATSGTVGMDRFADDLAALLDALWATERVTLCGLSMGGYIAWQFWKLHPHRLRRLILCDTKALPDNEETKKTRADVADRILKEGPGFLATDVTPRLVSKETQQNRPEVVASLQDVIQRSQPEGVAAALRGMAARPDATDWLPMIEVPTLLISGTDDLISPPREMNAIAEKMPNAKFVEIPNAGHMTTVENPEAVNAAIRQFLAET